MKFKRQAGEEVSVNLTPLIDVVFLLLIFFMVSTTFTKESQLKINLPEASSGEPPKQVVEEIRVEISAEGDYAVNGRKLANNQKETIEKAIMKLSNGDNTLPFTIASDEKASHEHFVRVLDLAAKLGFASLNISSNTKAN